jgi:radical SAM superfamily enzyme YgiQ (UPF0313 family)
MSVLPASISSLAAYLNERGIKVDVFDTTFYKIGDKISDEARVDLCQVRPFKFSDVGIQLKTTNMQEDFYKKVNDFDPDILAISANDFTKGIAINLISEFKIRYPNIHVIMGGMYPTFFPEHAISNPNIDSICVGEGYQVLYDLCRNIEDGVSYNNKYIPNLWVKEKDKIYKNPLRVPIDIDEIPFDDFNIFEEKRLFRPMQGTMRKMIPIWLDLGCPYNCTYCVAPSIREMYKKVNFNYLRVKSISHIENELDYQITKYKPDYIYFSSENFFSRPKTHIKDFAKLYAKKYKIPFWCETRVENINDENVKFLKEMGCDRISIGLESGNEKYRTTFLKKTFTNKQFFDAIACLNKHNLNCTINNIIGLPDETRDMVFDTIKINKEVIEKNKNIDITFVISAFVPCGGSGLQKYCIDKGYFDLSAYLKMPYGSFHLRTYLEMPQFSSKEVQGLLRTFPLYVRFSEEDYEKIKKAENLTIEGDQIFEELKKDYWSRFR